MCNRDSGRVQARNCGAPASPSLLAVGLIRLFLIQSRHRAAAFGRRDGPERVGSARSRYLKAAAGRAILIGGCKAAYSGPSWRKAVPTAKADVRTPARKS